mmetsp:Transcript_110586/g.172987  ORF Transcript_110586/g.172987 Transcript_110586/m.172987 type:complete len:120 (+) Transcript_110586:90-449(+)
MVWSRKPLTSAKKGTRFGGYSKLDLEDDTSTAAEPCDALVSQISELGDQDVLYVFDGVFDARPSLQKEILRTPRSRNCDKRQRSFQWLCFQEFADEFFYVSRDSMKRIEKDELTESMIA